MLVRHMIPDGALAKDGQPLFHADRALERSLAVMKDGIVFPIRLGRHRSAFNELEKLPSVSASAYKPRQSR